MAKDEAWDEGSEVGRRGERVMFEACEKKKEGGGREER